MLTGTRNIGFRTIWLAVIMLLLTACAAAGSAVNGESPSPAGGVSATTDAELAPSTGVPAVESPASGDASAPLVSGAEAANLRPIPVDDVQVQVGVGSPIPVDVFVSGTWPDLCAQIAEIDQRIEGSRVEISLMATPSLPDCPPDRLGLPFRIAIPLNMAEMGLGGYNVSVNGVEVKFEWDAKPGSAGLGDPGEQPSSAGIDPSSLVLFIDPSGNLALVDRQTGESRLLTTDALPLVPVTSEEQGEVSFVSYYFPALSSDGRYAAYRRDAGVTSIAAGMKYEFGLWVMDLVSGESRLVLNDNPAGFAWKPGTHLLAYGKAAPMEYFGVQSGGKIDASLANGIWALDMDGGEPYELVASEGGYTLFIPAWSPDGRFLSFDELEYMEGRGKFAYYDFAAGKYISLGESLGSYSWSPDGSQIAYDLMIFTPTGAERIYLRPLPDGEASAFAPEMDGYTFNPVFSPSGDSLAYFAGLDGPDSQKFTLYVQDLSSGEQKSLGVYEGAHSLSWTPDGAGLVFSAGPHPDFQVITVSVSDGASKVLASGSDPAQVTP